MKRKLFVPVKWRYWLTILVCAVGAGAVALCIGLRDTGRVVAGIEIAGKPVGGLTRAGALAVTRRLCPAAGDGVVVRAGPIETRRLMGSLGIVLQPEKAAQEAYAIGREGPLLSRMWRRLGVGQRRQGVRLAFEMDDAVARAFLGQIEELLPDKPRDATARFEGGRVQLVRGRPGAMLKVEDSLAAVRRWAGGGGRGALALGVAEEQPKVTAADLAEITQVIGRFSTPLGGSSANRRHNIRLASGRIGGRTLMPGEVFSYNAAVGPRGAREGFRTAPVIQGGRLVPGAGGGACQVSSTLYNAALLAGLEIVTRHHHSQPVHYLPPGRDATVWWGVFDLKFRNSTGAPVVLQAEVGRRSVAFLVLGKAGLPRVAVYGTHRRGRTLEPVVRVDPVLPAGKRVVERKGVPAYSATLMRQFGEGAQARREVVSRDYYQPVRAIIVEGPAAVAPEPEPEPAAPAAPGPEQAGETPEGAGQ